MNEDEGHEHQSSWDAGYEDGFEGRERNARYWCSTCYAIGFHSGSTDREEVQRAGSSNA